MNNARGTIRLFTAAALAVLAFVSPLAGSPAYAEYIEGEAVIVMRSGVTAAERSALSLSTKAAIRRAAADDAAEAAGARVVSVFDALSDIDGKDFALIRSEGLSTEEIIDALSADSRVIAASPNRVLRLMSVPSDPYYTDGEQWGPKAIGCEDAWDMVTTDGSVCIAILDTGIYADHPDLSQNVDRYLGRAYTSSKDPEAWTTDTNDGHGHGTHVAGIIGAVHNEIGIAGICPSVRMIPIKMLADDGTGSVANEIAGLNYIAELISERGVNIKVVNLSFGGYDPLSSSTNPDAEWYALQTLERLGDKAPLLVVAAGNESSEAGAPLPWVLYNKEKKVMGEVGDYLLPASYTGLTNMVVVSAIDEQYGAPDFANWGTAGIQLVAPGHNIWSTSRSGTYARMSGTSQATPHVSGAAALVAYRNPGWTALQIKQRLLETADHFVMPQQAATVGLGPTPPPQFAKDRRLSSHGLVRVDRALDIHCNPEPTPITSFRPMLPAVIYGGSLANVAAQVEPAWADLSNLDWGNFSGGREISSASGISGKAVNAEGTAPLRTIRADTSGSVSFSLSVGGQTLESVPRQITPNRGGNNNNKPGSGDGGSGSGGCEAGALGAFAALAAISVLRARGRRS